MVQGLSQHMRSFSAHRLIFDFLQLWNKYQGLLAPHERSTVIYGHDSHQGLQLHRYSKGLDTGCVKGGQLTAMVIDNDVAEADPKVVSVPCKNYGKSSKNEEEDERATY